MLRRGRRGEGMEEEEEMEVDRYGQDVKEGLVKRGERITRKLSSSERGNYQKVLTEQARLFPALNSKMPLLYYITVIDPTPKTRIDNQTKPHHTVGNIPVMGHYQRQSPSDASRQNAVEKSPRPHLQSY